VNIDAFLENSVSFLISIREPEYLFGSHSLKNH
jgi:hypothetical protein